MNHWLKKLINDRAGGGRTSVGGGRTSGIRVYNLLFPAWLLLFWPSFLWLFLIPANYLLDRFVLKWSLGDMPDKGLFCRKHTWKICLAGFFADFVGFLILLGVFLLLGTRENGGPAQDFWDEFGYGVGFNPFANALAFLVVALAVAVAGFLIYSLDKRILKRTGLEIAQVKRSALRLALITAPYLFFFPSAIIYNSSSFSL